MGNSCIKQKIKERNIFNNFGLVENTQVTLIKWKSNSNTHCYHWWQ